MSKKKKSTTVFDKKIYDKMCLSYIDKYKKEEEWKQVIIDDVKTKYAISNYGRIRNIDKKCIPSIYLNNNHYYVYITTKPGTCKCIGIYRLVALMFLPSPTKYFEKGYNLSDLVVDHKRDKDIDNFDDNTMWNLQWLTHRENISKASKCGYRKAFEYDYKEKLDHMILEGFNNNEIYYVSLKEYGYEKQEIKAMIQIRRRRLNKLLKSHTEHDKKLVKKIDELIKSEYTNQYIIDKLKLPTNGRESERLLQYRRSILNHPANVSKYFNNDDNKKVNKMISEGRSTNEIITLLNITNIDKEKMDKIKQTITSRRSLYKKKITSSTTIESIM